MCSLPTGGLLICLQSEPLWHLGRPELWPCARICALFLSKLLLSQATFLSMLFARQAGSPGGRRQPQGRAEQYRGPRDTYGEDYSDEHRGAAPAPQAPPRRERRGRGFNEGGEGAPCSCCLATLQLSLLQLLFARLVNLLLYTAWRGCERSPCGKTA